MGREATLLVLLFLAFIPAGLADDYNKDQGVKVNGVVFDMANDRKVETVGGISQPEDISKYVQRKMDGVTAQINELQGKLDRLQEQMSQLVAQKSDQKQSSNVSKAKPKEQKVNRNQLI